MKIRKPRRLVPRNPIGAEMTRNGLYRTRAMKSVEQIAQRRDPWDRTAKHQQCAGREGYHDD